MFVFCFFLVCVCACVCACVCVCVCVDLNGGDSVNTLRSGSSVDDPATEMWLQATFIFKGVSRRLTL